MSTSLLWGAGIVAAPSFVRGSALALAALAVLLLVAQVVQSGALDGVAARLGLDALAFGSAVALVLLARLASLDQVDGDAGPLIAIAGGAFLGGPLAALASATPDRRGEALRAASGALVTTSAGVVGFVQPGAAPAPILLAVVGVGGALSVSSVTSHPARERSRAGGRPAAVALCLVVALALAASVGEAVRWTSWQVAAAMGVVIASLLGRIIVGQRTEAALVDATAQAVESALLGVEHREQVLRSLVDHATDVVTLLDGNGMIRQQNRMVEHLLGHEPHQLVGHAAETMLTPEDRGRLLVLLEPGNIAPGAAATVEARMVRADGSVCETETTVHNRLTDEAVKGFIMVTRDVTTRRELEDELRRRAFHDALTGLGNRVLFRDRLEHAVTLVRRYGGSLAVMFLDLDGFKQVNDTVGHDAGDQLLVTVAERLRDALRASDTVARMGGDEFAVLLERPEDVRQAQRIAAKIVASLQMPVDVPSGARLRVSCSVGLDISGGMEVTSPDDLVRNADLAMYRAKSMGKGRVQVYDATLREAAVSRVRMESDLRSAVDNDELLLHFQPIVDLATRRITGVEALVRWQHPVRGLIPPGEFIPAAEDTDQIIEIGRWALGRACMELAALPVPDEGPPPWVSVNVAARQLSRPGLVQAVRSALGRSGLDPARLVLEITEGSLVEDPRATAALFYQLKDLDVRLAIDDFGTGYSSLSRLRTFPVDKLKIDRSFIQEIVTAADEAPIVGAVMAMAHNLGLTAVAEGVETAAQLSVLHAHRCEEAQGFLMSRPVPVEELANLLASPERVLGSIPAPPMAAGSALSLVIADSQAGAEPAGGPLLSELVRQTRADLVWAASVGRGVEVVTDRRGALAERLPVGSRLRRATPGAYLAGTAEDLPPELVAAGVASAVAVPILDDGRRVIGVLGAGYQSSMPIPASTRVLLELFTRLLGEVAAPGAAIVAPA